MGDYMHMNCCGECDHDSLAPLYIFREWGGIVRSYSMGVFKVMKIVLRRGTVTNVVFALLHHVNLHHSSSIFGCCYTSSYNWIPCDLEWELNNSLIRAL